MRTKSEFWDALLQLAAALAANEENMTQQERLQAIVIAFATSSPSRQREMRLAFWATFTLLEDLSKLIPDCTDPQR